jgi:hypothetical protein
MGFINLKTTTKLLGSFLVIMILTGIAGMNGLMNANAIYQSMENM